MNVQKYKKALQAISEKAAKLVPEGCVPFVLISLREVRPARRIAQRRGRRGRSRRADR